LGPLAEDRACGRGPRLRRPVPQRSLAQQPFGFLQGRFELWTSLTWLADNTERIEFGPLVSPVSARHPVITAWQASAVDNLAGGRLRLGLGAGWQEWEHEAVRVELLDTDCRFARFEEGLEVVTGLLRSEKPVSFDGEFYQLRDALLMPRSPRPGGPPLVVGGNGVRRTLPLAARYVDEWNAVYLEADEFAKLDGRLDELLDEAGRAPDRIRRTLMTRVVFDRTEADVDRKLDEGPDWVHPQQYSLARRARSSSGSDASPRLACSGGDATVARSGRHRLPGGHGALDPAATHNCMRIGRSAFRLRVADWLIARRAQGLSLTHGGERCYVH
jgi:alkanesulfonate monooxygenase SsuD/methylene tetrahydromethanopterin reductase-like flavin-dependent oxidoreductase (luciferase family)